MMNVIRVIVGGVLFFCCVWGISAQGIREDPPAVLPPAELPLRRISVFSSGMAFHEHEGTLIGPSRINLPFKANEINDVLMSLVVNDPISTHPFILYSSENTLFQTLRSLSIDLSDNPDMAGIVSRLRGAEIDITVPAPVSGRIIGVEYRQHLVSSMIGTPVEPWLTLLTAAGIRVFNFNDINSFSFRDPQLNADLNQALDLIASSRNFSLRDVSVHLPGNASRRVSLGYVVPAPVWKVSYRLDLGRMPGHGTDPLLQGWAIVDNDSDSDWDNIELSLVAGRPASFIQNLYPPYHVFRPTLPLAIAGAADGAVHDSGWAAPAPPAAATARSRMPMVMASEMVMEEADSLRGQSAFAGGTIETAAGVSAGDQFEFTFMHPISLNRRMSTMLPLIESPIEARRVVIFSPTGNRHPRLGAEITNTSGMRLPAGPITVYDGGTYAGDALIEFWNEGEKRLISYGDDLSVTGSSMDTTGRTMVSVNAVNGVMTINHSLEFTRNYVFRNTSSQAKSLIIEHTKQPDTTLDFPEAGEETPTMYRFPLVLPEESEIHVTIRESRPLMERISLMQLRPDAFLSYASSHEIPSHVRDALQQAIQLRVQVSAAENILSESERRRSGYVSEQERIRSNIEAAGSQSQQGQEYLRRLMALDASIDILDPQLDELRANLNNARQAYEHYVQNLNL